MKYPHLFPRVAASLLCGLCALAFAALGAPGTAFAADGELPGDAEIPPVTLRINERLIPTDVPPAIVESRTLVPARAVFETLGGSVTWDDSGYPVQLISVSCGDDVVNLTIGARVALVNGAEWQLDVPAQIVNDRTLIPVRFVSEALGFVVRWNDLERVVDIYGADYDIPPLFTAIDEIEVTASDAGTRVRMAKSAGIFSDYANGAQEPRRFSIGFPNTSLNVQMNALTWQREISVLRGVRVEISGGSGAQTPAPSPGEAAPPAEQSAPQNPAASPAEQSAPQNPAAPPAEQSAPQTDRQSEAPAGAGAPQEGQQAAPREEFTLWFTFELLEDAAPSPVISSDGRELYLDFPKPQTPFDPWADGKLSVALDPGHGAETVGKRSPDGTLIEYAFNRDMAARVKAHLERHGVEVILTVTDDTDPPLEERCAVANAHGADAFVSLHANASGNGKTWMKQNGWEIYVYKKGSFSERLANAIHDETIPASGLIDRGVKDYNYYVIRNVNMPAVLIEHGFFTNQTEIELLKSPEFRERLAVMDAKGILRFLGVSRVN
ncbi:MAG: N-acetylmuramoyl-L-alanine amidase [Clostridiales Family XIII bacterium]|jgi:N-acetylmuramoyl-L-alanine amidase|nr:N-acetylmuramoyl-L-alanine amidase [Clostridiales Family XIII bacterium]